MSRFLTADEKARELAFFAAQREDPGNWRRAHEGERAGLGDVGYIDHEVVPLCDLLNAIDGVCTLQSCCGHRYPSPSGDGDCVSGGLIRLRLDERMGRLLDERVGELLAEPVIRHVVKGYALTGGWERRSEPREPYEYIDLSFHGCEDGGMEEAERVIAGFFAALAASSSQDRDARPLAEPDAPPAHVSEDLRERRAEEHRRLVAERRAAASSQDRDARVSVRPPAFPAPASPSPTAGEGRPPRDGQSRRQLPRPAGNPASARTMISAPEITDELSRLLGEEVRSSVAGSRLALLTPIDYPDREGVVVYVEQNDGIVQVSDLGITDAKLIGEVNDGEAAAAAAVVARRYDVKMERGTIAATAPLSEAADACWRVAQAAAMFAAAGLYLRPQQPSYPLPQGRWLIEVCVECGGAVCVTDPPHRREHQSGVCRGFGCGGLRTVEVMPVPGAREEER